MSPKYVNTVEIDVFTYDIYFDTLQEVGDKYYIYDDGLGIMMFGQQAFSTSDPTTSYVVLLQGTTKQPGQHQLYRHKLGADIHNMYVFESENDGTLTSDDLL